MVVLALERFEASKHIVPSPLVPNLVRLFFHLLIRILVLSCFVRRNVSDDRIEDFLFLVRVGEAVVVLVILSA